MPRPYPLSSYRIRAKDEHDFFAVLSIGFGLHVDNQPVIRLSAVHVHVLPDAPVFTDEDERRELQSLTIKEITDIEKDLRGITSDMNGLRLGSPAALGPNGEGGEEKVSERRKKRRGGEETVGPAPSEALRRTSLDDLSKLELEILQMPPDSKESYIEACLKCPDLLTLEHKTAFIEYSGYDTHKAAIR